MASTRYLLHGDVIEFGCLFGEEDFLHGFVFVSPSAFESGAVEVVDDDDVADFDFGGEVVDEVIADDVEGDAARRSRSQHAPLIQRQCLNARFSALGNLNTRKRDPMTWGG